MARTIRVKNVEQTRIQWVVVLAATSRHLYRCVVAPRLTLKKPMKSLKTLLSLTVFASVGLLPTHASDNLAPEGTFEAGLASNGTPAGWEVNPGDWQNKPNLALTIMSEGASPDADGKNYLRLANTGAPGEGMFRLFLTVALPTPTPAQVILAWRVRAEIEELSTTHEWASVQCPVEFLDSKGNVISTNHGALRLKKSTGGKWLERETPLTVPPGTVEIRIAPGLSLIKGTVDFDDISLTPAPTPGS